jgi:hypothetical protein
MKKVISVELEIEVVNRLDVACKYIDLSRNALLKGMLLEKLKEIEDVMNNEKKVVTIDRDKPMDSTLQIASPSEIKALTSDQPIIKKDWSRDGAIALDDNDLIVSEKNCPMCGKRLVEGQGEFAGWIGCNTPDCKYKRRKKEEAYGT